MQAKDIPERTILEWLAAREVPANRYVITEWNNPDGVLHAMPTGTPEKVALAKMRKMLGRGLVDGCGCGCGGAFRITEKGRAAILAPSNATP